MGNIFQFAHLKKFGNELGLDPGYWRAYVDASDMDIEKRFDSLFVAN